METETKKQLQKPVSRNTKWNFSYRRLNLGVCILNQPLCVFFFGYVRANILSTSFKSISAGPQGRLKHSSGLDVYST